MDVTNTNNQGNDNPSSTHDSTNANVSSNATNPSSTNSGTDLSSSLHGTGKTDPAWAYFALKKEGKVNVFTCLFCASSYRGGGINRMKQHLAGVTGQVSSCKKVSHDVRSRMKESLKEGAKKKPPKNVQEDIEDIDTDEPIASTPLVTVPESSANKRKAHGSVGNYFAPRTIPGSQPSIKSVLSSKEAQHNAKMVIAEWAIANCIPFNTFDCPLFQRAVDAIASIGPGFKAPSAYDFRINLLSDWKKECQLLINSH